MLSTLLKMSSFLLTLSQWTHICNVRTTISAKCTKELLVTVVPVLGLTIHIYELRTLRLKLAQDFPAPESQRRSWTSCLSISRSGRTKAKSIHFQSCPFLETLPFWPAPCTPGYGWFFLSKVPRQTLVPFMSRSMCLLVFPLHLTSLTGLPLVSWF